MIWDKAQDLGRLIGQSTEYQALRRAEATLREDKDTVAKLDQIQTLARQVDQVVATGQMPDQATAESYETAVRDLEMSPVGQAYVVARVELREADGEGESADQRGHGEGRGQQHHHAGMNRRGLFVVLEGPEGSGKSTLAAPLADADARARGRAGGGARARRHPGRPRSPGRSLLDPEHPVGPLAELFFFLAARAELVSDGDRARRSRRAGWCSRTGSRCRPRPTRWPGAGIPAEVVLPANRAAAGGLEPDLTLILDLPPEVGRARQVAAGKRLDRLDAGERGVPPPGAATTTWRCRATACDI